MADNFAQAFGLEASSHISGVQAAQASPIPGEWASGYNQHVLLGDPLQKLADGTLAIATASSVIAGIFAGVYYKASNLPRSGLKPHWPASQVATNIEVMYYPDPFIIWRVRTRPGTEFAKSMIGGNANLYFGTVSSNDRAFGRSAVSLDISTVDTTARQCEIVGIDPESSYGENAIALVKIKKHFALQSTGI